jgi:hypothetical protein
MNHQFDVEHAVRFGIPEAIIMANLAFWIKKNKANKKSFKDGRYWTYNSAAAFSELFPYLSVHQVRRVLDKLEAEGVILKANHNQSAYDRTTWFAFTDEWNDEICEDHFANLQNGVRKDAKTLIDTDIKPDEIPRKRVSSSKTTLSQYLEQCQAEGRKPIPDDHCSRKYAADAGISPEMIALAWFSFVDTYRDGTGKAKKYADWGLAFNNAVKGNWAKLWYVARDTGTVNWTSEGLLYKATIDAKLGDS